ncbi:hypothetical protein [Arenicella chitinivorans]|nr:hypothetical protein [Arenicella chitinivorans]
MDHSVVSAVVWCRQFFDGMRANSMPLCLCENHQDGFDVSIR